jgi:hypothetical protein
MNISDGTLKEIRTLVLAGRKIEAIKLLREHAPVSLADAKKFIDWVEADNPSEPMPSPSPTRHPFGSRSGSSRIETGVPRLFCAIFLTVGVILLSISAWLITSELSFRKSAGRVEGVVVQNISSRRSFRPVFEFEWKGKKRRVESSVSSSVNRRPVYSVGEKVPMLVDPSDPNEAHVDSWFGSWFAATLTGALGAIFAGIGGGVLVYSRRK